ncbi:hypothetical protein JHJ32_22500, partial [Parapedobacter sp. ISTM3]|uniref:DUF6443 domain-containing protein n=1 Tax=Parapedobacter sp. ISTM3 TaxID=2800130 RepID=UPI001A347337
MKAKRNTKIKGNNHTIRRLIATVSYALVTALVLALLTDTASAQLVLNKPGATGEYTAPTAITLSPGFTSTGNFRASIAAAAPALGNAASTAQNHIQKTTYLRAFGDTPPAAGSLAVADAMRDVTYYDGLGRVSQEVGVKAAPNHRDVVVPVAYDGYGRQHRDYLPYATATGAGGAFKAGAVTQQASYYNSPPAGVVRIAAVTGYGTPSFGERRYEASPLDRISEQGFAGPAWQPQHTSVAGSGHTVRTAYAVNDAVAGFGSDSRRVARYGVTVNASTGARTLALNGIYGAGELYVTIMRDENWTAGRDGTVEEYTDKQGRMVLRRLYNGSEVQSTYYVYDDFGLLCFVLPPGRGTQFNPDGT